MPGTQHLDATTRPQQTTIRYTAHPDTHGLALVIKISDCRAAKEPQRQNVFQFQIDFPQDIPQRKSFRRHAIEDFSQWHRTNRRRQTMSGKVTQQDMQTTARFARGQQHITVEY